MWRLRVAAGYVVIGCCNLGKKGREQSKKLLGIIRVYIDLTRL